VLVLRAYKTELDLNDRQVTVCKQHVGAARWAYNWGLQLKQERYQATKKSPTAIELHRELNALKENPGSLDVPGLQVCPSGSPVEPRCRLYPLLPAVRPQRAGEVERQAGVSAHEDQEEGLGKLSAHRQGCRIRCMDLILSIGGCTIAWELYITMLGRRPL
jgi:hypothetical protein